MANRILIFVAVAGLLAGCCSQPYYDQFVNGFYDAILDQDHDSAVTYIMSNPTIDDQRVGDLPDQATKDEYISLLISRFEGVEISFSNMSCRGNTISWNEELCKDGVCDQYDVSITELSGEIFEVSATNIESDS
jgi:hypothetical protein